MARFVLFTTLAALAVAALSTASTGVAAAPVPTGAWPASKGPVTNKGAITVAKGQVFDGKMRTYDRSDITCKGQSESGKATAMFILEAGATLKNVIIGKNQMEGVHCDSHDCTIENVWWSDVCEDALTIKGGSASSVTKVIGGGARYADDKVVQHNGVGTVTIDGFYAQDFGKLYRSCGTCGAKQRNVVVSNVYVVNPKASVVTVNQNNKDTAKFTNVYISSSKTSTSVKVCQWSQATSSGGEPKMLGAGPSGSLCQYKSSDIHFSAPTATRSMPDNEEFSFGFLNQKNATA